MKRSLHKLFLNQPDLGTLMCTLQDQGHTVHIVGGAVRSSLMGAPVHDFDLATSADPEQVTDIMTKVGATVHPTGIAHGTVTVAFAGASYEVTTWRRDVSTDGRNATVAYSDNIQDDANRRDFTINALYASFNGVVHDPVGTGLEDAKNKRVRFIGNPDERIEEDALRILRYFRFSAQVSGSVDTSSDDFAAVARNNHLVDNLSKERVTQELLKILALPDAAETVNAMFEAGVLQRLLPQANPNAVEDLRDLAQKAEQQNLWDSTMRTLAVLHPGQTKDVLRLSKLQQKAHGLFDEVNATRPLPERLGFKYGYNNAVDLIAFLNVIDKKPFDTDASERALKAAISVFPVSPKSLMDRYQGKELGDALKRAKELWFLSGCTLSKDELIALVSKK